MTDRQHLLHIILHTLQRRLSMSSYLVPGIARSAEDLMHDVSCRTWPSGLMTAMSYDNESEGALSWFLVPQIQQITECHCGGAAAGQSFLVPRLTTMEHSRADSDRIHIAALLEWEMPTGEDGQELHKLSPGHTSGGNGKYHTSHQSTGDGGGRPSSVMSLGVTSVGGHSHGHPASPIGVGSSWEDIDPRSPEPLVVRGGWLWLIWVVRWTT